MIRAAMTLGQLAVVLAGLGAAYLLGAPLSWRDAAFVAGAVVAYEGLWAFCGALIRLADRRAVTR